MQVDLHIHSTYSDGEISISHAINTLLLNHNIVSFTDHEHVFDPADFVNFSSMVYISGVEISCQHKNRNIDIIGYDFDTKNSNMIMLVNKVKQIRRAFICEILTINEFSVEKLCDNPFRKNTPLPNIVARNEFWKQYNSEYDAKCHSLPASDVINTIFDAGGIAVLAHPGESLAGLCPEDVEKFILSLGINTIEYITPKHSIKDIVMLGSIIDRYSLSGSIGSDSHYKKLSDISHEFDLNERKFQWLQRFYR